jgi:hypothetical protein
MTAAAAALRVPGVEAVVVRIVAAAVLRWPEHGSPGSLAARS